MGSVGFLAHAERAFDITMEFIGERRAFGRAIGTFQNSRFKMAELRTQLDAAWALIDHCAREHLDGALSAEMAAEAKLFASEVEGRVADECLQLHGGAGYMDEYEISRVFADARISRIHGQGKQADDRYVIPMYHPAAALRNGSLREVMHADFAQIPALLQESR